MIDKELILLAGIGKKIEKLYGRPMDIEWAIDKNLPCADNILILQSRPETVWSQKRKESLIGKKSGMELLMERAMTPFKTKK